MRKLVIWALRWRSIEGIPGTKVEYYLSEKNARLHFTDEVWQDLRPVEAVEIEGRLYFPPKPVWLVDLHGADQR